MKIAVCVMAIMVMCICPGSISEEKHLASEPRHGSCRFPKGKHGSVRTDGCIKSTCSHGKWKPKLRTDICCYKQQVHKPNTVLDTIVGADNCSSTTIGCGAVGQLEFNHKSCSDAATKQQVEQLKTNLEQQIEEIENVTRKSGKQSEEIYKIVQEADKKIISIENKVDNLKNDTNWQSEKLNHVIQKIENNKISIEKNVDDLSRKFENQTEKIAEKIEKNVDDLSRKFENQTEKIAEKIENNMDDLSRKLKNQTQKIAEKIQNMNISIEDHSDDLSDKINNIVQKIENNKISIENNSDDLSDKINNVVQKIENNKISFENNVDDLSRKLENQTEKIAEKIQNMNISIENNADDLSDKINNVVQKIENNKISIENNVDDLSRKLENQTEKIAEKIQNINISLENNLDDLSDKINNVVQKMENNKISIESHVNDLSNEVSRKLETQTQQIQTLENNVQEKLEKQAEKIEELTKSQTEKIEELTKTQTEKIEDLSDNIGELTEMSLLMMKTLANLTQLMVKHSEDTPLVEGVLITGGYGAETSTELFLPHTGKTCSLKSLPANRYRHSMDTIAEKIILCGGGDTQTSCLEFLPTSSTGSWAHYATLAQGRYLHTTHVFQGELLLLGGSVSLGTTEIIGKGTQYDLQQHTDRACSIPDHAATILTGGRSNYGYLYNSVVRYNMQGFVGNLPDLATARRGHGCGYYMDNGNKVLVVAGGYGSAGILSSTELLPAGATSWTSGESLPRPLHGPSSTNMHGYLLLIGGYSGGNRGEVLKFDGTWTEVGMMKTARYYPAATKIEIPGEGGSLDISACI